MLVGRMLGHGFEGADAMEMRHVLHQLPHADVHRYDRRKLNVCCCTGTTSYTAGNSMSVVVQVRPAILQETQCLLLYRYDQLYRRKPNVCCCTGTTSYTAGNSMSVVVQVRPAIPQETQCLLLYRDIHSMCCRVQIITPCAVGSRYSLHVL